VATPAELSVVYRAFVFQGDAPLLEESDGDDGYAGAGNWYNGTWNACWAIMAC
jgi:hypothetical protein